MRKTAGCTLLDRKKTETIQKELNVTPIVEKVQKYRRRWREHINRTEEDGSLTCTLNYTPIGRGNRRKLHRQLMDTFVSSETDATLQPGRQA